MPIEDGEMAEPAGAGEVQEEGRDASDEEGMIPRTRKAPPMPSRSEVKEHMATHIPFMGLVRSLRAGKEQT